MPFQKGYRSRRTRPRRFRRKRYIRRRRGRRVRMYKAVATPNIFPKSMVRTLRYADNITISDTAPVGNTREYIFSCNGAYDPDITSGGHQPLGFDQMMALYNHYTVIGSKINIRWVNGTGANTPVLVGCTITPDTTTFASTTQGHLMEYGNATKSRYVGGLELDPNFARFTQKWSVKKYFPGSTLANDLLKGASDSNPIEQSYYHLWASQISGSAFSTQVYVMIDYIIVFHEPRLLGQS